MTLDDEDYRFSGWYGDSGKIEDGDMALLPEITKEAGTYAEHDVTAFWQPAITIAYHVLDSVETVKDFGEIGVYGRTAEAGDKMRFDGWFDENGNRIDDDAVLSAPAITAMKAGAAVINVFARFTEIKEEVVPAAEIADMATPLAAPEHNWALINLIAMIAAAAGANEDNRNMGRVRTAKAAGLIAGAVSMIAFFLTEDMSLPMVLADRWTILMIILLAVQAVSAALVKKACESEEDEEAEAVAAEM